MKIRRIEAMAIRLPRDIGGATGTAGSPTKLAESDADYRWSSVYPCLYSVNFETALVRVETDAGIVGWGEAQAPLAPEVACTIIDRLLAPVLRGEEFDGSRERIEQLWDRMYSTMRVRGQTGGFMIDAIAAVDIALWDIAGRLAGLPVCRLLSEQPKTRIPAYLSGVPRGSSDVRGFDKVKLFFDTNTADEFFAHMDAIPRGVRVAVDALWRHAPESAIEFGRELDARSALWFEAPLAPEDALAHAALARAVRTPIAIGESYRTCFEMTPFFRAGAVKVFQPDLGRCGITEAMRMAAMAAEAGVPVTPHISIAFGPQVAAALHFAAATGGCDLAEYNPHALSVANRYLAEPIALEGTSYVVPGWAGSGDRTEVAMSASPVSKLRWWIAGLLFTATVINYIDRQTLSVVAPVLTKELGISNTQYSNILTAFLVPYTFMYVVSGYLCDRWGTRRALSVFMSWWSAANALHALARGAMGLGAFRFLLGMGESGNFMAAEKAISEWFPAKERAFANGLVNAAAATGAIISPPLIAWVTIQFGWRAAFVMTGLFGFVWLTAWLALYRLPQHHPRISEEEKAYILEGRVEKTHVRVKYGVLLRSPPVWGLLLARVFADPVWWFYLFWLPKYLSDVRHFSLAEIGLISWMP